MFRKGKRLGGPQRERTPSPSQRGRKEEGRRRGCLSKEQWQINALRNYSYFHGNEIYKERSTVVDRQTEKGFEVMNDPSLF